MNAIPTFYPSFLGWKFVLSSLITARYSSVISVIASNGLRFSPVILVAYRLRDKTELSEFADLSAEPEFWLCSFSGDFFDLSNGSGDESESIGDSLSSK